MSKFIEEYRKQQVKYEGNQILNAFCWIIAVLFVGSFFVSCGESKRQWQVEQQERHERAMDQVKQKQKCIERNGDC